MVIKTVWIKVNPTVSLCYDSLKDVLEFIRNQKMPQIHYIPHTVKYKYATKAQPNLIKIIILHLEQLNWHTPPVILRVLKLLLDAQPVDVNDELLKLIRNILYFQQGKSCNKAHQ